MKRQSVRIWMPLATAIIVLGGVFLVTADTGTKPVKGMVIGEVVDIAGYVMAGAKGEKGVEAGNFRASQGFPIGILEEETGELFVAVYKFPAPATSLQPANSILGPYMGLKVTAQGLLYKSKTANVIRLSNVTEY